MKLYEIKLFLSFSRVAELLKLLRFNCFENVWLTTNWWIYLMHITRNACFLRRWRTFLKGLVWVMSWKLKEEGNFEILKKRTELGFMTVLWICKVVCNFRKHSQRSATSVKSLSKEQKSFLNNFWLQNFLNLEFFNFQSFMTSLTFKPIFSSTYFNVASN